MQSREAVILTYLGLLPFILLTLGYYLTDELFYKKTLLDYGVVISAYLYGTHWGLTLKSNCHNTTPYLLRSNFSALILVFLISSGLIVPWTLGALFIYALYADYILYCDNIIDARYWRMRLMATLGVCTIVLASQNH